MLPRRCYQQIVWLLQYNYLTYQICLKKFHILIPIVCKKSFSLATCGHIYNSYVKSALLYACKTWPLNVKGLSRLSKPDNSKMGWVCSNKITDRYSTKGLRETVKLRSVQEHLKFVYKCRLKETRNSFKK